MRLIDADALREWFEYRQYDLRETDFNNDRILEMEHAKHMLDTQHTIEAVPVKWIEEWYKKKADKPFVADDVSVRLLLRDWREEQC